MWARVSKGAEVRVGGWVDIRMCIAGTYVCVRMCVCMLVCVWASVQDVCGLGAQRFRVYRLCWCMGCSENVLSL